MDCEALRKVTILARETNKTDQGYPICSLWAHIQLATPPIALTVAAAKMSPPFCPHPWRQGATALGAQDVQETYVVCIL